MSTLNINPKHLALFAALGIGAYWFASRKAVAGTVPGRTTPRYSNVGQYGPRAPGSGYNPTGVAQPADPYYGLGRLIGGLFGGGSSNLPAPGQTPNYGYTYGSQVLGPSLESFIPDDALAANPPANVDPAMFEAETWGALQ